MDPYERNLVLALVLVIALSAGAIYVLLHHAEQERAACIASGRAYVIDHYNTTYIAQKIGTTTIMTPVQSPVYVCKEQ